MDIEKKLKTKHKEIRRIFTSQDRKVTKNSTRWKYHEEGGGVSTELLNGKIIEKAAINFSSITGTILPKSALSKKIIHIKTEPIHKCNSLMSKSY